MTCKWCIEHPQLAAVLGFPPHGSDQHYLGVDHIIIAPTPPQECILTLSETAQEKRDAGASSTDVILTELEARGATVLAVAPA